jgi:hypothetical protein
MGIPEILDQAEATIAREIQRVELLGEISTTESNWESLAANIRIFGIKRFQQRWPHCLAMSLIGVARFRYDGDAFWPQVQKAFGLESLSPPEQAELGKWFEQYLSQHHLPTFRFLVEQGALRYLTPILAHALIPRALVANFLEHLVWPAIEDPLKNGATAEEIQERMARAGEAKAGMPRPLLRFVVHGGNVARDIIDRSIRLVRGLEAGESGDVGLPGWLREAMTEAAEKGRIARSQAGRRRPPVQVRPGLRFDPVYTRVQVELPYLDDREMSWVVADTEAVLHRQGWQPPRRRIDSATLVTLQRPFLTLTVSLTRGNQTLGQWTFDGLAPERPYIFFDRSTRRATGAREFVNGTAWYLLTPVGTTLKVDGTDCEPLERLGSPTGRWSGLEVTAWEVPPTTERVSLHKGGEGLGELRLRVPPPAAELEVPELPRYLAPASDDVLAFESNLPTIRLPRPTAGRDANAYLDDWSIHVAAVDGQEVRDVRASNLAHERLADGGCRVRLEEAIPGFDVGMWDLRVEGPLGRSLAARIALLPNMTFSLDEAPGVAGPELKPASVVVTTRDGVEVVEEGDTAAPSPEGWILHDRNQNGRIPFTVTDSRTGRTTRALIQLPTVQWQWSGFAATGAEPNTPQRFAIDTQDPREAPVLLASGPDGYELRLSLLGPAGRVLQEERPKPLAGRGAVFPLEKFLTTAEAAGAPSLTLRLELLGRDGQVLGGADVATLALEVRPEDVRAETESDATLITWRMSWRGADKATARIGSLGRPWEPACEGLVEELPGGRGFFAQVPRQAPGRYRLELFVDDGWIGPRRVSEPAEFSNGSGTEQRQHIQALPPTVAGKLERILLSRDEQTRREELDELANQIGPYQLAELATCVAGALKEGRAGELLNLRWTDVGARLVGVRSADIGPLLEVIAGENRNADLARFCVAIGMDRWPGLREAEPSTELVTGLWRAWPPLGAFLDLPRAMSDEGAAARCNEGLGWAPARHWCASCQVESHGWQTCHICGGPISDWRPLPEAGTLSAPNFSPRPETVEAMRRALMPVPSPPLGKDGWLVSGLGALEQLAGYEDLETIWNRLSTTIDAFAEHEARYEKVVRQYFGAEHLEVRGAHHAQYPWAYACRMSLIVALLRRLLAHKPVRLAPGLIGILDESAAWLSIFYAPIYEHDLCWAEALCCQEFVWSQIANSTR